MRQTVGYQRFDTGGGVNRAAAVVCDAPLVQQFLSANDEAEKQRATRQSGEEALLCAPNALPTSVGGGDGVCGGQETLKATVSAIESGSVKTSHRQAPQRTLPAGYKEAPCSKTAASPATTTDHQTRIVGMKTSRLSSRFLSEATNQLWSRFLHEATGRY